MKIISNEQRRHFIERETRQEKIQDLLYTLRHLHDDKRAISKELEKISTKYMNVQQKIDAVLLDLKKLGYRQ